MLLHEKTLKDLNISVDTVSENSHKRVWVSCDYCGSDYTCTLKNRTMSYKNFPKDCCSGCKFKKREEISLNKYGVKNSAQRQDVKSKLSSLNFEDYFSQIVELAQKGFSAYKIAEKLQLPITSLNRYIESKKIDVIKNNRNITTTNALLDKHGSKYREILSKRLSDTSKKLYQVDNFFQSEDGQFWL